MLHDEFDGSPLDGLDASALEFLDKLSGAEGANKEKAPDLEDGLIQDGLDASALEFLDELSGAEGANMEKAQDLDTRAYNRLCGDTDGAYKEDCKHPDGHKAPSRKRMLDQDLVSDEHVFDPTELLI